MYIKIKWILWSFVLLIYVVCDYYEGLLLDCYGIEFCGFGIIIL